MAGRLARAALLLAASASMATAEWTEIPEHSFVAPFKSFDKDGLRTISNWRLTGNGISLNENFLRLTPDRQSKRGVAWNQAQLSRDEWSATLRFRVSGQGKRLFGDGFALWYTSHPSHRDGGLHGFSDTFKGFGLVFDTYVNTEPGVVHRDIQLVSSDGSAPVALSKISAPVGCDADFRYYEGRDDFSVVANTSAARVRYAGGKVSVWIDARADGNWKQCIDAAPVAAPENWHRDGAWLGLTATTGDLADNHDILQLSVAPEDDVAPPPAILAALSAPVPEFRSTGNPTLDESIQSGVAAGSAVLTSRMEHLAHSLEHQLAAMEDSLRVALKRVSDLEAGNAKRIEELEKRLASTIGVVVNKHVEGAVADQVNRRVEESLASGVARIENAVAEKVDRKLDSKLESKVASLETKLGSSVESTLGARVDARVESSSRPLAVAIVAVLILAVGMLAYTAYGQCGLGKKKKGGYLD